ncbi:cupin domain-containing protein [Serratia sp. CY82423]|uniref:cupin domain-containing protein n=1 Tax=Serratia sp. CY82423 TaxID=3383688 RepID=UPI003FA024CD
MEILSRTPSTKDELEIIRILRSTPNNGESFDKDKHLNEFIEKPWGCEYRVYCDSIFDVWKLHLDAHQSTSMHCHIQKDTVLICLSGSGATTFLDGESFTLQPGRRVYINKGVFHQTVASEEGIELIEVENPRNKFDLLRLQDSYGRQHTAYEKSSLKHDLLSPMEEIGPGMHIRHRDLHQRTTFKINKLDKSHLSDHEKSIFIALDVKHHLSGKIHILDTADAWAENYHGQKILLITSKQ